MDVGSLNERADERGYAHFLEHLVFRQSKYLGDGEAIAAWQRLGATFGSDTNAETTPTSTTFKIDLPQATESSLDQSFKLLSGMMIYPTLSTADIHTDLPIVLAEKRERGGTAERVQDAMQQTFFAGQPLADRPPIGTTATLEAATQGSVRAFHARWYRPENAVVIAVGDIEPAFLAAEIKKWFSDWPAPGKAEPAPSFGAPAMPKGANPANPVGETRVLVEPELPRNLTYVIERPWHQVNDNIAYNQGLMIDQIGQAIINRRLEAKARAGGSFLLASVSEDKVSRSVDMTSVTITPLTPDWRKALGDVRAVIADALDRPPSQAEIDREIAEIRVAFESQQERRRLQPSAQLADDLTQAVDIRETVAAPDAVLRIFDETRPMATPAAVLAHTRALFRGNVVRGFYLTPAVGEASDAQLKAALLAPVRPDGSARLSDKQISFADLPPIGTPQAPVKDVPVALPGIEQLDYANGVKVLMWPSSHEPGRSTVKVRFGTGYREFAPGDAPYIMLGDMALVGSGVGPLGQEELDRISTGRKMGFDFDIDDGIFTFSADTRPADLADQLYLFAAKFAMPRWDANPVLRAKAAARLQYDSFATSPQGVLQRDLSFYQHAQDPRYATPTPEQIDQTTPEIFRKVWAPILARGPIEVQVFGDFDRAAILAALNRTFGALPPREPLSPGASDLTVAQPAASLTPIVLTHRGDANQAAALISWPTGGGSANIPESRQLEVLAQLFSNRLLEAMREKSGASYAPQVYSQWPVDMTNGGALVAIAQLTPRDVPVFYATADEIAADLAAHPPSADELARVVGPLTQQVNRALSSVAFFMSQLEGATSDPRRINALGTVVTDYTQVTPALMQQLAAKYLVRDKSWRLAVIPAGQKLAVERPHDAISLAAH
jgi:zinc protease